MKCSLVSISGNEYIKNPTRSYRFNEFKQIWSSENNFLISSLDLFYIKKRIDMDHLLKLIC